MRALIAYFSRADENYFSGTLRRVKVGNTEIAAELLEKLTGADRFKIDPIQPYSPGYNACIAEAQDDQRRDARPELKEYPDSLDGYDAIYLGYPNYWGTMPMAERPSAPSAPTRAAAWGIARLTSGGSVPAQP